MANAVATRTDTLPTSQRYSPEQVDLIKRTICKGSTDDELRLFMYQAEKTGLDPLARQIYSIERREKRGEQWVSVRSIQTSIDGFRLVAERSGKYAGQVGPYWCGQDGEWRDVWLSSDPPAAARVGVLRSDFKEPCWGVARFDAYAQKKDGKPTRMWATMADVMVAKCAESLALRRAFPQELSGLYTNEEMELATAAPNGNGHALPAPPQIEAPHDPVTGEVLPHAVPIPLKGDKPDWTQFGIQLLAGAKTATTEAIFNEWLSLNGIQITNCAQQALPVHTRLTLALEKIRSDHFYQEPNYLDEPNTILAAG